MHTCDECSVHIHQKCLVIPLPTISCDSEDHAQYKCHNHPMTLVKHDGKCDRVVRHCLACQSHWSFGLAYTCQKSCENVLHKACAELPQKIEHPSYHPHHSLKLQFCEPRQSCSACYKRGGKLMYFCCDQGCNFILGTECAFLAPTMTWNRDDDHFLFLIERAYYGSDQKCYFCHNSYEKQLVKDHNEVIHTQSFLFRCFECDFNIHFLCGPFPSIIKHECHVHSLSLVDYIDDDDDSEDKDSNDYYCDACEKKRNPQRFRVYYCGKCKYVAHIHCVISEVIKILKGDLKNVELLALGDNRWKNTNEEGRKDGEQEEEAGMSIQTLGDLMESLTDAERKQLLNPYGDSTGLKALHDKAREENSRRYERKDDGEDIHRIQNLFNITPSDINDSYMDEFWYFNSEEGLKFDERHLKMKVVDVEGYKVPRSLAPVLQTLLRQNGDFVRKSRLRPEMKSIACTFLCILAERMSMTNPEDITKDLLKHWVFYYRSVRTITGLELDFLGDILSRLVKSFLGSEAIKFKKEMAERLPQQITELQLQLETSKANLEKLKGIGDSTASDFMKECFRERSKFKRMGCL
ncbi:hypothetical protein UlMin_023703 [Ulmus minor]